MIEYRKANANVEKRRMLGNAPPGSKIIWHNDPSGPKEISVQPRPFSKKGGN